MAEQLNIAIDHVTMTLQLVTLFYVKFCQQRDYLLAQKQFRIEILFLLKLAQWIKSYHLKHHGQTVNYNSWPFGHGILCSNVSTNTFSIERLLTKLKLKKVMFIEIGFVDQNLPHKTPQPNSTIISKQNWQWYNLWASMSQKKYYIFQQNTIHYLKVLLLISELYQQTSRVVWNWLCCRQ